MATVTVTVPSNDRVDFAGLITYILSPRINLGPSLSSVPGMDIWFSDMSLAFNGSGRVSITLDFMANGAQKADFSDAMEQNGTITYRASDGQTLVVDMGDDEDEPYIWNASNGQEIADFANHVDGLTDQSIIVTFNDQSSQIFERVGGVYVPVDVFERVGGVYVPVDVFERVAGAYQEAG